MHVCVWICAAVCDLLCVGYTSMAKTSSRQRGQFILDVLKKRVKLSINQSCADFNTLNCNRVETFIQICNFSQITVPLRTK